MAPPPASDRRLRVVVDKESAREFKRLRSTAGAARSVSPRFGLTGGIGGNGIHGPTTPDVEAAIRAGRRIPGVDRAGGGERISARWPLAHASGPPVPTSASTTIRVSRPGEGSRGVFASTVARDSEAGSRLSPRSIVKSVLAPPARAALDRMSAVIFLLMISAFALAAPATYRRLRPYLELTYGSGALLAAGPAFVPDIAAAAGRRAAPPPPKRHAPWRAEEIFAGLLIAAEAARAGDRRLTGRLLTELREHDPRVPSWSVVHRAARRTGSTGGQWLREAERGCPGRAVDVNGRAERVPELA